MEPNLEEFARELKELILKYGLKPAVVNQALAIIWAEEKKKGESK